MVDLSQKRWMNCRDMRNSDSNKENGSRTCTNCHFLLYKKYFYLRFLAASLSSCSAWANRAEEAVGLPFKRLW